MGDASMELSFSEHAEQVMEEREISIEWIQSVLDEPALRVPDGRDQEVELFFRRIPAYGNRVLRVVVNTNVAPWKVVSVFFDRNAGGRL